MYCLREKHHTGNASEHYARSKNGRLILKAVCATCGAKKSRFVQENKTGAGAANYIFPTLFKGVWKGTRHLGSEDKSDYAAKRIKKEANKYMNQGITFATNALKK